MAGNIKEGSVMEGIFAMYCAAYLIDPNNGKSDSAIENFINDLRVDTQLGDLVTEGKKSVDYNNTFPSRRGTARKRFGKDLVTVTGKEAKELIPQRKTKKFENKIKALKTTDKFFETIGIKGYPDFSQVELKVRVKEAETGDYYGEKLQKFLDEEKGKGETKDKIYNNLKARMRTLLKAKNKAFFMKLQSVKSKYLANKESDVIRWTVDADGIAGETSGGDIKQDVTVVISADGKRVLTDELNFSLKASSKTIHGGGVYNSVPQIYEMFKSFIPPEESKKAKLLVDDIKKGNKKYNAKASADALWKLIGASIESKSDHNTPYTRWTGKFWGLLEKRLFGKSTEYAGQIQLVEMNPKEISEVTKEQFEKLKSSGIKLYPVYRKTPQGAQAPGDIRIYPLYVGNKTESKESLFMYNMTPKYRSNEFKKVQINLGGKESLVHDENWDKYIEKKLVKEPKK